MDVNRELWDEYRRTWEAFTTTLDEEARAAHNAARDRLAEHLTSREHRVRNTAKMIWEFSGRPEGTAESDWYRAEKVWLETK